jgi:hypothetical protein
MYRIGTIVQSDRAEQAKRFLPAELSACPAARSTTMKMQLRIPRIRYSDGQTEVAPAGRTICGPPARLGFTPSPLAKFPYFQTLRTELGPLRSVRGRNQIEMLHAGIELHSDSADILSDSNLDIQSQLTICED